MKTNSSKANAVTQSVSKKRVTRGLRAVLSALTFWSRKLSLRSQNAKMRLCETLSLGDKRFLAVVLVEQQKFLVGGAANSVALLTRLPTRTSPAPFEDEVHLL